MSPIVAGLLVGLGLALAAAIVVAPRPPRVRLADLDATSEPSEGPGLVDRVAGRLVARTVGEDRLARFLIGAGIRLAPTDLVARIGAGLLVVGVLGGLAGGPGAAVLLPLLLLAVVYVLISGRRSKRAKTFAAQLPTTLQTLVASLRAGYSLPQALESVVQAGFAPTSEEFDRMLAEVRVGRPLGAALRELGERMSSADFDWIVIALEINEEVGGNLSEVLETVEKTIRDRESLRRNIRTLSAEGRVSAIIIFMLPFATLGLIALTNPAYVAIFYTERIGMIMAGVAAVLMVFGGLWLRNMIRVKF